jgi:predicted tellurium resistance membrane protein TerC
VAARIASRTSDAGRARTAVKRYVTGYLAAKTVAMDNFLVISMICTYFAVPHTYAVTINRGPVYGPRAVTRAR